MAAELPDRARTVIIGGGIIGASTAYHLAKLGWTDTVLIEQGHLSGGTTWHAAGLVGQLRATESGTRLVQYSARLYSELEEETGLATGFKRCGGVTVARTPDRMVQLQRTAATAEAYDLECRLMGPDEARELYPILRTDDLVGAIWLPGDGTANPVDVTASLARGARDRGVRICEETRVTGVEVVAGRVGAVATDKGRVEAEFVVNCAGQWAKAVGLMAGVNVPLHSAEHFYVVTEQIDGVHRDLPILRDPDGYTYFKEEVGGLVVGGFEPEAKPWVPPDQIPYPFEFQLLDEDWEHFSVLMESALHRIPVLERTGIRKFYNGPDSFTPDNQFILGEALPPLRRLRPPGSRRRPVRLEDGMGAGERVRPAGGGAGARLHLGQAELARVVGRRAESHPPGRRRVRPELVRQAPGRRARRRRPAPVAVQR
jgi:4-methylaminobutanoate oxidase (formaldehyde-forming)